MADVKPSSSVPAYTKGIIYYINAAAKTISMLPSTEGASGFTAVSLAAAKSDGGGSCVTALGFPRPNLVTLLAPANNGAYGQNFGPAYDFLVATPTSVGTMVKSKLNPEAANLVPSKYSTYNGGSLTVSLNIYDANMVMGSASGDPLLYALFTATDGNNFQPYGDILLGIRINVSPATGARRCC